MAENGLNFLPRQTPGYILAGKYEIIYAHLVSPYSLKCIKLLKRKLNIHVLEFSNSKIISGNYAQFIAVKLKKKKKCVCL